MPHAIHENEPIGNYDVFHGCTDVDIMWDFQKWQLWMSQQKGYGWILNRLITNYESSKQGSSRPFQGQIDE